jgi:hypothetical protein
VRIEVRNAMPRANVVEDEVLEHGGLPHAGLPDEVHVAPSVIRTDPEPLRFPAEVRLRERRYFVFMIMFHTYVRDARQSITSMQAIKCRMTKPE